MIGLLSLSSIQFKKFAIAAAQCADAKQGTEISVLDLRKVPGGASEYSILISANSHVHMKTLRDFVEYSLKGLGLAPLHRDGTRESHWVALDYGGLLVHIFLEEARGFYSLERLWPEARPIAWDLPQKKPPKKPPKKRKS